MKSVRTELVADVLHSTPVRTVGLRELRQDASELVRCVENGEKIEITVAGRPAAMLVPMQPAHWQGWGAIADLFVGPPDPNWEGDRDLIDQTFGNVWDPAS